MTTNNKLVSALKKIELTQGKFALVDEKNYDFLMIWKWRYSHGYAIRDEYLGRNNGKQKLKTIFMHRVINKTPDGLFTDHIDGNKLDNREVNLRDCTNSENQRNAKNRKNTSSKYKGVSWNKYKNRWIVKITVDGKQKDIGRFQNEIMAAQFYNDAAVKYYGEFAKLNEIEGMCNER